MIRCTRGETTLAWLVGAGLLLAALGACSARAPVDPAPPLPPGGASIEALVRCGSYDCLTRALALALERRQGRPTQGDLRQEAARVALLLALRERQIGILGDGPLATARELVDSCPDCQELQMLADGVALTPAETGGVDGDLSSPGFEWERFQSTREALARWRVEGQERPKADPASTAFCLGLVLPGHPGGQRPAGEPEECGATAHEEVPLVLFSRALARGGDPTLARQALALEPSFHEAHLLLGHRAEAERRMGAAEEHYRQAFEALPQSVQAGMALADLSFSLEAWPRALSTYEHVARLAPEHREAHLRRGIVLTFLGRPGEAVAALERLLDLGFWFLGETHYWLARNKAAMGRADEAKDHVAQAAHYLPDDPRVHELSGRLAFEAGAVDAAERDYLKVVEIDSRWPGRYAGHEALCGSLSGLARIASTAKAWQDAAARFEQAAECQDAAAELVDGEIATIRTWQLPPSREARLVQRKERVRDELRLRRATALYNAAACAFNAGERVRATGLAEQASEHPAYAEKADVLIARILAAY